MKEFFHNILNTPFGNTLSAGMGILVLLSFQGCSKTTSPGSNCVETRGPYSITDTIRICFARELDTSTLAVTSNNGFFAKEFEDRQTLLIYGDTSALGVPHFRVGKNFSIQLDNILDLSGNQVEEPRTVNANFLNWLDGDYDVAPLLQKPSSSKQLHRHPCPYKPEPVV